MFIDSSVPLQVYLQPADSCLPTVAYSPWYIMRYPLRYETVNPRCLLPLLLLHKSTKQINYTISVSFLFRFFNSLCFLSPAQYIGNYLRRFSDMTTATGLYKHEATCNWFVFSYQWVQSTDSCSRASIRIRIRTQHSCALHSRPSRDIRKNALKFSWISRCVSSQSSCPLPLSSLPALPL